MGVGRRPDNVIRRPCKRYRLGVEVGLYTVSLLNLEMRCGDGASKESEGEDRFFAPASEVVETHQFEFHRRGPARSGLEGQPQAHRNGI